MYICVESPLFNAPSESNPRFASLSEHINYTNTVTRLDQANIDLVSAFQFSGK